MAWASCKMNNFGKFKFYHACTILLAMTFVGIKSYEYHDKFTHYELTLADGKIADGHLVHNTLKMQDGVYTGAIEINGHVVEKREELYNLKEHHHKGHEHLKYEGAQITKVDTYGPWHNTYTAIYFTLTGLHALHVIGGALVIAFLWGPGAAMWKTDPERFTNRIEISGLFWHFVDLVWIFLFPVLYLL
jgi:cytochrome c oxidase subunit 3